MTDEQWVWLYVNRMIDNDEKLDHMCSECKEEVLHGNKCTRCDKSVDTYESFVNPNFDEDKYNRLKNKISK